MKKLFTLALFVVSFVLHSQSQNVTISPSNFDLTVSYDDYGDANATVTNNTNTTRTFRWIRIVEDAPAEWTTTVCDKNNCYSSATASQDFVLAANAGGLLRLTVNPNLVTGEGHYQIVVFDIYDSTNTNAVLHVNAVGKDFTGIADPIGTSLTMYPIPAKDILNINFDGINNANSIAIYNVVGQKMKSVNVYAGSKSVAVPVADLKKGVYFLRVYSNNKEVVTKTFTKE
ncbi:MAG: T9SS type A sorting domain-containing protein [Chitinophagales bacterium]|nr:T9SS type A sorting domain-containing protein [Chitinophagales bacterium]